MGTRISELSKKLHTEPTKTNEKKESKRSSTACPENNSGPLSPKEDLPEGSNIMDCKWVFKKKINAVYYCCLVAKGYQELTSLIPLPLWYITSQ